MTDNGFPPGTRVFWYSQGGGILKRKEGEVIEVVQPGVLPATKLSNHVTGGGQRTGRPRNHVSFVVLADNGEKYWPLAKNIGHLSLTADESDGDGTPRQ